MSKELKFRLLVAMIAVGIAGFDIYLAILPSMDALSRSSVTLSYVVTLFAYSISQLLYGPASDIWGIRRVAIFGFLVYFVGCLVCYYGAIENMSVFIVGRAVQGIGIGCIGVLSRYGVTQLYSGSELIRKFSIVTISLTLVPLMSPLVGAYSFQYFGEGSISLLLAFSSFVLLVITYFIFRDFSGTSDAGSINGGYTIINGFKDVLCNLVFLRITVASACIVSGEFLYNASATFHMQNRLGFSPSEFGQVNMISAAGLAIGSIFCARYYKEIYFYRYLKYSYVFMVSGAGVITITPATYTNPLLLVLPMALYFVGLGLIYAAFCGKALSAVDKNKGTASGLMSAIQIAFAGMVAYSNSFFQIDIQMMGALLLILVLVSFSILPARMRK